MAMIDEKMGLGDPTKHAASYNSKLRMFSISSLQPLSKESIKSTIASMGGAR